ncbi:MAG: dephospho-CoA kinase [Isosphaeraceae bacterium]|nr:dephospho-CoA kinase [Isosphaeraceae bacterium]
MARPTRNNSGRNVPRPSAKPARSGRWRNGNVPVLGLIGGIGSGKTLVGSMLGERGAIVVEADKVGHSLIDQRPARDKIIQRFGSRVLDLTRSDEAQPPIDRKALGAIVFSDPVARKDLEAILHPSMKKTFERVIDRAGRRPKTTAVVIDAAVLFEAGWNQLCDAVLFVDSPRDQRLARLAATRGWTSEMLDARESAQLPLADKKARADHVIRNDADLTHLQESVESFWTGWTASSRTSSKRRPSTASGRTSNPSGDPSASGGDPPPSPDDPA